MQYLFDVWNDIVAQIKAAKHIMLLLDYDGTLTAIVEKPELADLPLKVREILKTIGRKPHTTIGIVSGRSLNDLKSKVNLSNIIYAGNHGLEIEGRGMNFLHPVTEEIKATLKVLNIMLSKAFGSIEGAFVENKGMTLTVHYRQVENKNKEAEVKRIFDRIVGVARMLGRVKITSGKKVYEIRPPVAWDKGKAVNLIIQKFSKANVLPVYVGDDLTDEDAFKEVQRRVGISVYVGGEDTRFSAKYFLNTTNEVPEFLERLNEIVT